MKEQELEDRISRAFDYGEVLCRELRLTTEEACWVSAHYPARLTELGAGWYHMEFLGAYCG